MLTCLDFLKNSKNCKKNINFFYVLALLILAFTMSADTNFFWASNESPKQIYKVVYANKNSNLDGHNNITIGFIADKTCNSATYVLLTVEEEVERKEKAKIRKLERYEFPKSMKTGHKKREKRPRRRKPLKADLYVELEEIPSAKNERKNVQPQTVGENETIEAMQPEVNLVKLGVTTIITSIRVFLVSLVGAGSEHQAVYGCVMGRAALPQNEGENVQPQIVGENKTIEAMQPELNLVKLGGMALITLIGLLLVSLAGAGSEHQAVYGCVMGTAALPLLMIDDPGLSVPEYERQTATTDQTTISIEGEIIRETRTITVEAQAILYEKLRNNRDKSSKDILVMCEVKIELSISQVNRIRKEWGFPAKKGRPKKRKNSEQEQAPIICRQQENAGAQLFAEWLEEKNKYDDQIKAILYGIEFYQQIGGEGEFRLLHARIETIKKKWKALTMISLLQINRLSELDYHEHHMGQVLGYEYSYSTLTQFLGQLERIDAGYYLNIILSREAEGDYCYIDTHKIPYWSRKKMNKGKITSNGRTMAGSCAVIAQDQNAQTIAVEYHPPDTHIKHVLENFCTDIANLTGITNFIIDREAHSVELAKLFVRKGWDLICMLSSNQYKGLESFKKHFSTDLEDGSRVYKATWKESRDHDPRKFVVVKKNEEAAGGKKDKVVVYSATPQIAERLTGQQTIEKYRDRTEIQENTFKDMKSHGALSINYGRKSILGEDRSHQRKTEKIEKAMAKLEKKLQKAQKNIADQRQKVLESLQKGHQSLLQTRQKKLDAYQQMEQEIASQIQALQEQKNNLGSPGQRADRDCKKQLIMTCRTAWLENRLKEFAGDISQNLEHPIDIETLLALFFRRSAKVIESQDTLWYRFDSKGLSRKFQIILGKIIDGFNRISLSLKGKKVIVQLI